MEISSDVKKVIGLLNGKKKLIAMLAPSFVVDFKYPDIVILLKQIGFDKVSELTFGAHIINKYYHEIIKKNPDKMFISTACPVVTMMIKSQYPAYAGNLVPVLSPMAATARILEKNYPKHDIVFIAPCPGKKEEAKIYGNLIDAVITYKELKQLIGYAKENAMIKKKKVSGLFDKFYADYTKIYPLSGGLTNTLKKSDILKDNEIMILEGPIEMQKLFSSKIPKNIRFLDVLFCKGGCIGGPGIESQEPIESRRKKVLDYLEHAKHEKVGVKRGLMRDTEGVEFNTPEKYVSNKCFTECDRDF
jgi:iron only hydrogenase large subunit-like protein